MIGHSASATDPGRRRRRNEDAFVCEPPLYAIADGMGGARAGEIASRLAAAAVREGGGEGGPEERVRTLIQEANARVHQRANEDSSASGMGTTMTVALVEEGRVTIGHVGDSRAYLLRGGVLEQLTDDHSLVGELVRSGKLSPEEAESHPQRSVITRVLGTEPDVDVDTFSVATRPGDVFLLSSDGLSSMVADEAIGSTLGRHRGDLDAAARALVDAANRNGGEDNITVVLFELAARLGDTAELPPAPVGPERADDEDTLSGLDAVPAADEIAVGWDPGADSYEPAAVPGGPRRRRLLVASLVFLALLAAASLLALWGLSRAHFVGAESDGHVAVYQGLPYDVAGVRLYRSVYVSRLLAAQLSQRERRSLFDHDLIGQRSALREVKSLEAEVIP
ncbi:MAG: Stp1/IreP family PP2C-type Ser/Thr phosphatase [Actinobacteria bacterium]|nr:Stp1/IreP family PP2C-type Ser/Thr phosphatase [Actinomycetota bacterium]